MLHTLSCGLLAAFLVAVQQFHLEASSVEAFTAPVASCRRRNAPAVPKNMIQTDQIDFAVQNFLTTPSFLVSDAEGGESWRQYVPLGVSCFIILDILLGSPVVNIILSPMRNAVEKDAEENGGVVSPQKTAQPKYGNKFNDPMMGNGSRIDVDELVRQTKMKLSDKKDLEDYLERTKTDEDRIKDLKNKIQRQLDN